MKFVILASLPVVTALIGWFTNWVAIRMLFRPRKPLNVLGIKWQGLIPRRQEDLAEQIADIVESEILQQHTITQAIEQIDFEPELKKMIDRLIDAKLKDHLATIPFVGNFINDSTLGTIKKLAYKSIQEEVPGMVQNISKDLESRIQIRAMVKKRMDELDLDKLEEIVKRVANKEFRRIEQLGAVLGFIVGLLQLAIIVLWEYYEGTL